MKLPSDKSMLVDGIQALTGTTGKKWLQENKKLMRKSITTLEKLYDSLEKDSTWVEIFGMFYLYRFIDENHNKVLRFNKSLFVQFEYLEEL